MADQFHLTPVLESNPPTANRSTWFSIQQFRFLPTSYLATVGSELDPGLDELVYLRMFVEDETDDVSR